MATVAGEHFESRMGSLALVVQRRMGLLFVLFVLLFLFLFFFFVFFFFFLVLL